MCFVSVDALIGLLAADYMEYLEGACVCACVWQWCMGGNTWSIEWDGIIGTTVARLKGGKRRIRRVLILLTDDHWSHVTESPYPSSLHKQTIQSIPPTTNLLSLPSITGEFLCTWEVLKQGWEISMYLMNMTQCTDDDATEPGHGTGSIARRSLMAWQE